ncbi:MAG: M60 family metallopeptidase, partial [Eubacteriales bacterium]|nr:M60 family metallopeptidase [Eubacteriales bacterium]
TITGLENGKKYILYVVAKNDIGESPISDYVEATPAREIIVAPTLPEKGRIDSSNIASVEMGHKDNYDPKLYPDGFDTKWLYDGDYETDWVARAWWETNSFKFTFEEAKDMDYLIWVPRLDGKYRESISRYNIDVWLENDDLSGPGRRIAEDRSISNRGEDNSYYVLDFPKQEKVKKIEIRVIQWNGSPTNTSASEVVFYEYNDISDRIAALFKNSSRTELADDVTNEKIEDLVAEVSDTTGFVVEKEILLQELNIARELLNGNQSVLGVIKDNVYSIDTAKDAENYQVINNFQPLGVVGAANQKIVVYADIPEGETVQLIPTQYFAEADGLTATPITLINGRNVIIVPKIGSAHYDRGGSLYITYNGNRASEIKLQILGGQKIPYLELKDFHSLREEEAKDRIREFIVELKAYVPTLKGNLQHQILNSSEISLPQVLLSLPANKILEGIQSDNTTEIEAQVEKVYNTILAWEELLDITYKVYGIDDNKADGLESRQNIRYMRMFGNAFMYASGNHVGIGFDSVPGMMKGKPSSAMNEGDTSNSLFGWGIAHEIGHVLDRLGKAEVTNNIYSLMGQTYDGDSNTLPSRLEISEVYPKIFDKVSVGTEGIPNDVFVHLGMYWQLHLAYDGAENPFKFYNELHKLYRTDDSLKSFTDMDKFAVASSKVAQKNLTKFFTRWGVKLSEAAKSEMAKFEEEERAIYYLTDESRRQMIAGNTGNSNISVNATAQISDENPKEVTINISDISESNDNIQGYEIIRNGKSIGFTTTNTFVDTINSANNMSFTYEVLPVDIVGNLSQKVSAGEVRISYDKTIDRNLFEISSEDNGLINFTQPTTISGIKITPKNSSISLPTTGDYTVSIQVTKEENDGSTGGNTGGNAGESTEGNTGGNAGESTEGNTGGNAGESTEGNTGRNTGESTEGNTDENTGESTEGNTGENTDGSTDGNTGENTDGSTDGNTGENTGGSTEGNTGEYILAKNSDFSINSSKDENAYVAYFNKPGETSDKIWTYDATSVKLTGIDTNLYNIDFISYPGDDIEFLDMGIGRLSEAYNYGDGVIEAGTLVIVGNYRGNTVTNEIIIKGKFATESSLNENATTEERPVNGYTLMFDEIPESGKITSATSQGLFIFVPDIQKEAEIQGDHVHGEEFSILPTEIKAEMFKNDANGKFMTTDTLWISMPSDESLPQIEIK